MNIVDEAIKYWKEQYNEDMTKEQMEVLFRDISKMSTANARMLYGAFAVKFYLDIQFYVEMMDRVYKYMMKKITIKRLEDLKRLYSDPGMHRINGGSGTFETSTGERIHGMCGEEYSIITRAPKYHTRKGELMAEVRELVCHTDVPKD